MPTTPEQVYFPVLVQIVIALVMGASFIALTYLVGKRVKDRVKDTPYESGIAPTGDARHRFSVKFYLVGMLFILFDMEAIFLYPWAVVYKELKIFGFFEMLLFIVPVLCGFFYIWKKGVLDWAARSESRERV
jgi:NADH-quinone oxidoreductase subunit A